MAWGVVWRVHGVPQPRPGFVAACLAFGVCQAIATLALSKALKLGEISIVTALWKVSLIVLLVMGYLTLRERPSLLGLVGVGLSTAGVYLLNVRRARLSPWAPLAALVTDPGQRWTLLAAFFYAPSVLTIKQAALLSDPYTASFRVLPRSEPGGDAARPGHLAPSLPPRCRRTGRRSPGSASSRRSTRSARRSPTP